MSRRQVRSTLVRALGALLFSVVVSAPAFANPILTFTPAQTHINIGDSVIVDATISGLGADILSAFDLNFVWNSAIAQFTLFDATSGQSNLGPAWGGDTFVTFFGGSIFDTVSQGNIGITDSSLESDAAIATNQLNNFLIAEITLEGVANGVTTLTLGPSLNFDRNFVGSNSASLNVNVGSACIAVGNATVDQCGGGAPVPEPASLFLVGTGLVAAARARRRLKA